MPTSCDGEFIELEMQRAIGIYAMPGSAGAGVSEHEADGSGIGQAGLELRLEYRPGPAQHVSPLVAG